MVNRVEGRDMKAHPGFGVIVYLMISCKLKLKGITMVIPALFDWYIEFIENLVAYHFH